MAGEGPFAVDPESGFLLVTRALDREEQAEYQLRVRLGQGEGDITGGGRGSDHSFLSGHPEDRGQTCPVGPAACACAREG